MTFKIDFPEGTPENIVTALQDEAVASFVGQLVESAKQPLIANRDSLLEEKSQLAAKLREFGGIEGVVSMKTEYEGLKATVNNKTGKEQTLEEMLTAERARNEKMRADIAQAKVEQKIKEAFKGADLEVLEPFIKQRVKHTVDEDGNVKIEVFRPDGTPMLKRDGKEVGKEADLKDLFAEFKTHPKLGMHIEADNISGSGARNANTQSGSAFADNPFVPGPHFNLTRAMELVKTDPETAKVMASAANYKLPPSLN